MFFIDFSNHGKPCEQELCLLVYGRPWINFVSFRLKMLDARF